MLSYVVVDGPGGEHLWDIPVSRITPAVMKVNLATQCVYALASIFIKCALLILYLRIFRPCSEAVILIWVGVAFVLASHIGASIASIRILVPRNGRTWFGTTNSSIQNEATKMVAAQGVLSVVTDVYVLAIPMSLVTGLHLPFNRKVGVCAIFATGFM